MLDEFKHTIGDFYRKQSSDLLQKQLSISQAVLTERTGRLNQFLSGGFATVNEQAMEVTVPYPIYIRFLDMKRAAVKGAGTTGHSAKSSGRKSLKKAAKGKLKQNYAPIYNKYVYGYLKSAIHRRLRSAIPSFMIKEFTLKK